MSSFFLGAPYKRRPRVFAPLLQPPFFLILFRSVNEVGTPSERAAKATGWHTASHPFCLHFKGGMLRGYRGLWFGPFYFGPHQAPFSWTPRPLPRGFPFKTGGGAPVPLASATPRPSPPIVFIVLYRVSFPGLRVTFYPRLCPRRSATTPQFRPNLTFSQPPPPVQSHLTPYPVPPLTAPPPFGVPPRDGLGLQKYLSRELVFFLTVSFFCRKLLF